MKRIQTHVLVLNYTVRIFDGDIIKINLLLKIYFIINVDNAS